MEYCHNLFFTLKPAKRPYHKKKKIKIEGGDPTATITSGGLPSASTAATPSALHPLAKVENKSKFDQKVICGRLVLIEKKIDFGQLLWSRSPKKAWRLPSRG